MTRSLFLAAALPLLFSAAPACAAAWTRNETAAQKKAWRA